MNRYIATVSIVRVFGITCLIAISCHVAAQMPTAGSPLPDVGGLRPGIPLQQAVAQLKAHDKLGRVMPAEANDPLFGDKPFPYELLFAQDVNAAEIIQADLTSPPDPQMVWRFARQISFAPGKQPLVTDMLAALRQKYGPESYAMRTDPPILYWHFDESGHRVKEGNGFQFQNCTVYGRPIDSAFSASAFNGGAQRNWEQPPDPLSGVQPGCRDLVTVSATIGTSTDRALATGLTVYSADFPLAAREYQKTLDLIHSDAAARRRQELEKAHQQAKPTL